MVPLYSLPFLASLLLMLLLLLLLLLVLLLLLLPLLPTMYSISPPLPGPTPVRRRSGGGGIIGGKSCTGGSIECRIRLTVSASVPSTALSSAKPSVLLLLPSYFA